MRDCQILRKIKVSTIGIQQKPKRRVLYESNKSSKHSVGHTRPYFSIWSGADHLYDKDPVHWSQIRQQLRGYVNVDGVVYSFLGDKEFHETIGQTGGDATSPPPPPPLSQKKNSQRKN